MATTIGANKLVTFADLHNYINPLITSSYQIVNQNLINSYISNNSTALAALGFNRSNLVISDTGAVAVPRDTNILLKSTYSLFNCLHFNNIIRYKTSNDSTIAVSGYNWSAYTTEWKGVLAVSSTSTSNITSLASNAFKNQTALTQIDLPTSLTTINSSAFYGCTGLTSITIPSSVTSIGSSAFQGCTGLTSITIPDSVTSIGASAFQGCTGLTTATVGSGITSIGNYALNGCTKLTTVYINATTPPTLGGTSVITNTAITAIYVPYTAINTYKSSWSTLSSIIKPNYNLGLGNMSIDDI